MAQPPSFPSCSGKETARTIRDFDAIVDELLLIASVDFVQGEIEDGDYRAARSSLKILMKSAPARQRALEILSPKPRNGFKSFAEMMGLIRAMLTGRKIFDIIARKELCVSLHNN